MNADTKDLIAEITGYCVYAILWISICAVYTLITAMIIAAVIIGVQ